MSGTPSSDLPFAEFLDDYFVECDEHLTLSRRCLLSLERLLGQPQVDATLLNDLFRSFHSIKGLSAMVGVRDAERLAHQMESYLSALRSGQLLLSQAGLDALVDGVNLLEKVIASRRAEVPPPDVAETVARFEQILAASGPEPDIQPESKAPHQKAFDLNPEQEHRLATAVAGGARAWWFTFVPSQALSERGVNVNSVRERLQQAGQLIQALPAVTPGGQISFTFLITSREEESAFRALSDDGLTYSPFINEPVVAAAEVIDEQSEDLPVESAASAPRLMPSNIVRVDLSRLDHLMQLVGELVVSRSRLDDGLKQMTARIPRSDWRSLQEINQAVERQLRDLREGLMRVRLVPVREIFARMQFVVRDLDREHNKPVSLELSGQETEIDKFLVERLMDPLLHLVRNAVSHGLESPAEREARGKPAAGKLWLRATATGETILIEVEDDGRGIDAGAVVARARAQGLPVPDGPADEAMLLEILCTSGFSTRDEADRTSGRGVGMAVVRSTIEELAGTLAMQTQPDLGTRFTIQLPLTLAIADSLIVDVAGQMYAVPQASVREVLHLNPEDPTVLENNELIPYREGVLPLVRLAAVFGLPRTSGRAFYALVVGTGSSAVAIGIDRVVGLREIVVRPLSDPLVRVPGVSGATELGDGRVVLILDTAMLTRASFKHSREPRGSLRPAPTTSDPRLDPASSRVNPTASH